MTSVLLSDGGYQAMMVEAEFTINPTPTAELMQPASIDIRMGGLVKRQIKTGFAVSPSVPPVFDTAWEDVVFTLYPGEFYLANTLECFMLGPNVAMQLEGKSSWARCGLEVHSTAGWIDPGFYGELTLEMKVAGVDPVTVRKGEPIAQVSVFCLDHEALRPYGPQRGNHYAGQSGAQEVVRVDA